MNKYKFKTGGDCIDQIQMACITISYTYTTNWMITTFFISAGVLSLALSLNKDGLKV